MNLMVKTMLSGSDFPLIQSSDNHVASSSEGKSHYIPYKSP